VLAAVAGLMIWRVGPLPPVLIGGAAGFVGWFAR
jgi:hypothetical protein